MENNRSYRIRTTVGRKESYKIDVPLTQTYDMFEILSLKLQQKNEYNFYDSDYGIVVGRVVVNGGVGLPNAKISIFIESDGSGDLNKRLLYNFSATNDTNADGVRYNLLPDYVDNACHQDVGTFPNKRLVLDNNDMLEVFDKYYKYTTVTNESGDYMLFGIPTGTHTLFVNCDLSDIGQLSQRPRDMVYKGYNINQFESPNKFKKSTNLNSLSQIYSQDKGVFVYPYWGNKGNGDNGNIAITRCDIEIEYKIEPTCVFIGSIVTDKGANAIGKNCTGTDNVGKMSDLSSGEGTIEMIRKTIDGKVEDFQIKGNRLIDGDGVWCYQIPMNLDYVTTDEFGNVVPTDDPSKGIPTRARVRFRISMDENPNDATARKRCKFLVPNNPRYDSVDYPQFCQTKEADYEFGSATRDESYCDLFWNNVYTVKSYIPRLQKNKNTTNRKHTGIKLINHYGDNNPMPYNSLSIKLSFTYRLICVLVKVLIWIIATINTILALIMEPLCQIAELFINISKGLCFKILGMKPLCWLGAPFKFLGNLFKSMIVKGITLGSSFCDDGINRIAFYPILMKIAPCVLDKVKDDFNKEQNEKANPEERETLKVITITSMDNNQLITCIENNLAQSNDATSFNFQNDWVNGVLYAPLWYRKITPKKTFLFGLFKRKAKDQWCRADGNFNLMVYQACALDKKVNVGENIYKSPVDGKPYPIVESLDHDCKYDCHDKTTTVPVNNGLILTRETMLGQTVYYYRAIEYNQELASKKNEDGVILLFATDIVLLGSLNDCDMNGIPQFFRNLDSTTYNMPTDILFTDTIIQVDAEGNVVVNKNNDIVYEQFTEATGCDWGNLNSFDECGKMGDDTDGGLFYGIGCSSNEMTEKSCLNLSRVCEFGVSLDDAKDIANLGEIQSNEDGFERLTPDGFISFDELYNINERSMFATLNGNRLRTRLNNKNGLKEYDLRYLYTDNFDGLAKSLMRTDGNCNYKYNHNLEQMSRDYYLFRMGTEPFFYDENYSLARYENSFYFYFGLKMGKTAIDKFNSQFFAACEDTDGVVSPINVEAKPNSWCTDNTDKADGYVLIDLEKVAKPYDIVINSLDNSAWGYEETGVNYDKLFLGNYTNVEKNLTDVEKNEFAEYAKNDKDMNFKYVVINDKRYYVGEQVVENDKICTVNEKGELGYYEEEVWIVVVKGTIVNGPLNDIPNGEYEITITDADGQIIPYRFSMTNKKVQFSYEKVDNEIPNNQRISENGVIEGNENKEDETRKGYVKLFGNINDGNINEYGGYIKLMSVIDNFEGKNKIYKLTYKYVDRNLPDNYKAFMKNPYTEELPENDEKYGASLMMEVDKDGNITSLSLPEDKSIVDKDGFYYILTPLGDVDYEVTITELCGEGENKKDSKNSSKLTIRVNDTMPFKLFINDIDVAVFDVNKKVDDKFVWDIGWSDVGVTGNGTPAITNLGFAWTHLVPEGGIGDGETSIIKYVNDLNNYYDLTKLEWYNEYLATKTGIDNTEKTYFKASEKLETAEANLEKLLTNNNKINKDECNIEEKTNITDKCKGLDEYIECLENNNDLSTIEGYDTAKSAYDTAKSAYDTAKSAYDTAIKELKGYLEGFVTSIKETFWLTSDTQPKDINISVQTNKFPINYYLKYNMEESGEKQYVNALDESKKNEYADIKTEVYAVNDILIPTITNSDNENYGYSKNDGNISNGSISFGYDRQHGYDEESGTYKEDNDWVKKPYGIRIAIAKKGENNDWVDIPNKKLPVAGNVTLDSEEFFFFHIIDKVLRFKMTAWSYVNNIPYPPGEDDETNSAGKYISMVGLVDGEIHNGILDDGKFRTFSLGNTNITLFALKNGDNDNSIPTRRYINESEENASYPKYKVGGDEVNFDQNYIPVQNSQETLNIEDSSSYISETIYGNMSVELTSNDNDGNFQFTINNGDNNGDTKLIFVCDTVENNNNAKVAPYPLKNASFDGIKWKANVNGTIMGYDTKLEGLYEYGNNKVTNVYIMDEETGDYKGVTLNESKYTENGQFKLNLSGGDKFYVVAVTGNNCRALSPLYDYASVSAEIFLATVKTMTELPKDGTSNENTEHKLGVLLTETIPHYLKYYKYNVNLKIEYSEEIKMDETVTVFPYGKQPEPAFFKSDGIIEKFFTEDFLFGLIKNKIHIIIKDCTNLSIDTNETFGDEKTYFSIMYKDENNVLDETTRNSITEEGVKYYKEKDVITLLNAIPKGGYQFEGWLENGQGNPISGKYPVTAKCVIFTPQVTPVTVTFNLDGGNIDGSTDDVIATVHEDYKLPKDEWAKEPVKENYEFADWDWEEKPDSEAEKTNEYIYTKRSAKVKAVYTPSQPTV